MNTLYVTTCEDWRAWLHANHDTEPEVWFIFYKKHTGQSSLTYSDAVEEALCFGWVDRALRSVSMPTVTP